MTTDSRSSLVVVLLGVLTVLFPALAGGHGDAPSDTSSAAAPAAPAVPTPAPADTNVGPPADPADVDERFCAERMVRPLLDYYRIRSSDIGAGSDAGAPDTSPDTEVLRYFTDARRAGRDPKVVIATVPDPIDSALAYDYDRNLEALQLAVERSDRVRDRGWLPWSADPNSAEVERIRACRRISPGIILFRGRSDSSESGAAAASGHEAQPLMALLVVGETPTWGVHKPAFRRALDFASRVQRAGGPPRTTPTDLHIVGPTFSGTAESMRLTLRLWAAEPRAASDGDVPDVRIVSGSATSTLVKRTLEGADGVKPRVSFQATTIPDDALTCAFYAYLHAMLGVDGASAHKAGDPASTKLADVALLHESGTTYGDSFSADAKRDGTCYGPESTFGFPPHIGSLRSAYAADDRRTSSGDTAPPTPRSRLDPSLEETTEPRDVAPTLSTKTTFAHDALLANLLLDISRKDVRYLGLVGTDPADVVFLARQIKKVVPDVRLFTFGSEVLYLHPTYETDLLGMLVVTPYPYFGSSGPLGTATPFSGETPQGTYNAALALFGDPGLVEYRPEGSKATLPVWITVVSRRGLMPLHVASYDDAKRFVFDHGRDEVSASFVVQDDRTRGHTIARVWQIAIFFLSLFALYNIFGFLRYGLVQSLRPPPPAGATHTESVSPLFRAFHRMQPCLEPTERAKQSYYVATCFAALLVAESALVAATGESVIGRSASLVEWLGQITLVALFACFGASVVVVGVAVLRLARDGGRANRVGATIDTSVRAAIAIAVTVMSVKGIFAMEAAVFTDRATSLASGVSPTTPVLIVAACMYVWSLAHLTRVQLLDAFHARAPEMSEVATSKPSDAEACAPCAKPSGFRADLDALEAELLRTLQSPTSTGAYWVGSIALVGAAIFLFFTKSPLVFEGTAGRMILGGAFVTLVLATGTGLVWMLLFWLRLQALLERFAQHPILDAFGRLPKPFARSVEDQISSSGSDVTDLVIPVQQVVALDERIDFVRAGWDAAGAPVPEEIDIHLRAFQQAVKEIDATLQRELGVHTGGRGHRDLAASATMKQLVQARASLFAVLEPLWERRLPAPPRADASAEERIATLTAKKSLALYGATLSRPALAWLRLAEEFVATQLTFDVSHLVRHFRHFLLTVTVGGLSMLMVVSAYAVQPRRLLLTFIWIVILSVAGCGLWIFMQMDRNVLLSRIAKTQAGKLTFDRAFIGRVLTWVVLPIFGVALAQYPDAAHTIFAWTGPFAKALH